MTDQTALLFDIEVYHQFFYLAFKRTTDGLRREFEMSGRTNWSEEELERMRADAASFLRQYTNVGFNSLSYDLPLVWYWINGATNEELKSASDRIIQNRVKWWEVEDMLEIRIPWEVKQRHIDLIEPQPNPFASLKVLNGRLHGVQMQDLPFDPHIVPTHEEMGKLRDYCFFSDLDATHNLWNAMQEPVELRDKISEDLGQNVRSKSDTQMGLAIIKRRVEAQIGGRLGKPKVVPGRTFKYTPPDYIKFKTPQLQDVLERLRQHEFVIKADGKVDLPPWLKSTHIDIGESSYSMGIGGLHSTEANRSVRACDDYALCDFDVASYYPAIILNAGLYPELTGKAFIDVYASIRQERIAAKKAKDKVTDKSLKIALNGTFGSLGNKYSFVYAPHLLIAVTLTGQLALLQLIEAAELAGISVVSGNTDGVVMRIPRHLWDGLDGDRPRPSPLADVIENWERETGFDLEGTEYSAIYNQSVNSYFAIQTNGKHKRKGPLGNPWAKGPENDLRSQMMKNPQMTICSDAALEFIKHGTPVADTIRNCKDIRQFITVINVSAGATWDGEYLGKVVRYYWGLDGQPIFEAKANANGNHKKVPKSDGARELMRLPEHFPDDIDYDRYVEECESILWSLGAYGDHIPTQKPIRLTKKNREKVLLAWALAI